MTPRLPILLAALLTLATLQGCLFTERLESPFVLYSPYDTDRQPIIAVAPLRNESGVSVVDELAISDELVAQIEQVAGLRALPINRSLEAMRALGLPSVETPREARILAQTLSADAIIVGTVTAWHPYEPPRFGLSIALFSAPGESGLMRIDIAQLQRYPTDQVPPPIEGPFADVEEPMSVASAVLDASNHIVRSKALKYAWGRTEKDAPLGPERWLKSMERYTEFSCFVLVEALLDAERRRLLAQQAALASAD